MENDRVFYSSSLLKIASEIEIRQEEQVAKEMIETAVSELVKKLENRRILGSNRWTLDEIISKRYILTLEGEVKTVENDDEAVNRVIGNAVGDFVKKIKESATIKHQWDLYKASDSEGEDKINLGDLSRTHFV
jgi:preprotein translocase subunit SecA